MSEWPQRHWAYVDDEVKATQVIPADLGRELYEALRVVEAEEVPPDFAWTRAKEALARYEREVGK